MSRIRFEYVEVPTVPPTGTIFIFADEADNRLKTIDNSGTIRILDSVTAADLVKFANDAAYVTAYGGPTEGNIYWNTTFTAIRTYNGSTWASIDGGGWVAEVADFASLPVSTGSGAVYLVLASTGFDWNTQRGLYRDDGPWNRLSNSTLKSDTLEFDTTVANPAYSEGLVFYDNTKKAVSYYNDESHVTVNTGQEVLIPVYNDTGVEITNGQIVYPSGVDGGTGLVTIGLADAAVKAKCRLVGMATHSIEIDTTGYVTRIGSVGNLDTLGLAGIVYLSATTPGAYTTSKPDDSSYITAIGAVGVSDATNGTIIVDPSISELTIEVTDTNGFPSNQRTGTTLTFDDGLLTLTIASTGTEFHYYQTGDKYEKTSSQSTIITDVEGQHAIYFDGETLTSVANPVAGQIELLIRTKCLVSYLYWNATDKEHLFLLDERHGISMSPNTHTYLHFTRGCQFLVGLALNNVLADDSGNDDVDAQFGVEFGIYADEDLTTAASAVASTVGLPIYYLDGAAGNLRKITETGFSVLTDTTAGVGVTGRLVYNEFTGATWQLTTITNNAFVLAHVFAINGVTGNPQSIAILGQADYGNLAAARAGAETEVSNLLLLFPSPEIIPVATVIFQTSDSYSNAVHARVRTTEAGEDYVDWRTSELIAGAAPSSHNNLSNLEIAGTAVTYGHIDDQPQTIAGEKTFSDDVFVENENSGYTAVDQTTGGLYLTSGEMDTTNKFTNGIFFGSTDSSFTTNNPKLLAGIFGRATEDYAADSDSGMAIDFFTTLTNQGATTTPERKMSIESDEIIFNPDYKNQDWRMFKSGSGVAWHYDASTDEHRVDGDVIISGGLTETNNFNCTGHADFNKNYLDKNFYIRKLSSGIAIVYDGGNDNVTFGCEMIATDPVFMSGLKSGVSQVDAGAAANELWIDTADQTIKVGT